MPGLGTVKRKSIAGAPAFELADGLIVEARQRSVTFGFELPGITNGGDNYDFTLKDYAIHCEEIQAALEIGVKAVGAAPATGDTKCFYQIGYWRNKQSSELATAGVRNSPAIPIITANIQNFPFPAGFAPDIEFNTPLIDRTNPAPVGATENRGAVERDAWIADILHVHLPAADAAIIGQTSHVRQALDTVLEQGDVIYVHMDINLMPGTWTLTPEVQAVLFYRRILAHSQDSYWGKR